MWRKQPRRQATTSLAISFSCEIEVNGKESLKRRTKRVKATNIRTPSIVEPINSLEENVEPTSMRDRRIRTFVNYIDWGKNTTEKKGNYPPTEETGESGHLCKT